MCKNVNEIINFKLKCKKRLSNRILLVQEITRKEPFSLKEFSNWLKYEIPSWSLLHSKEKLLRVFGLSWSLNPPQSEADFMMVGYQRICQWFQNRIFFKGKLYCAQCVGIKLSFNESPILNYLMKCDTPMDSFWDLFRFTLTQISHSPSDQDDTCKKLHANKCFTSLSPKPAYSKFKSMYYKTIIRKHLHISFCWLSVEYYFEELIQLFFVIPARVHYCQMAEKENFHFFFKWAGCGLGLVCNFLLWELLLYA